jgi:monoamine oxidase
MPVTRVGWKHDAVEVRAGGRLFSARAIILTLPLGVMLARPPRRGAVRFDPPLRAKRKVIAKMGIGHVVRITLRFDGRRWKRILPGVLRGTARGGFGFIHSRMAGVPVWWSLGRAPVLTGWAGGPMAAKLARRSRRGVFEKALASLGALLGVTRRELRRIVTAWEFHNWSRDPYSRGAYSFITAGHERAAEKLREPMRRTLFFAGEATAGGGEAGTVHGALTSGLRAAEEVRAALRK